MTKAICKPWVELVELVRCEHNGIFGIRLFLGHDGHNVCQFDTYDETLARGESGRSMQEAVKRCIDAWKLEVGARCFARNPQDLNHQPTPVQDQRNSK